MGKQEGAGHSPHHLQPRPEHDQGSHFGETSYIYLMIELLIKANSTDGKLL